MNRLSSPQFEEAIRTGTRWIDVRAPVEFQAGSIPGAVNLPILNDDERHLIGLTYKKEGPAAAVALGHRLVSGEIREARIRAWRNEIDRAPGAVIYCFRGGLRSQITQAWLAEAGVSRPLVEGGYKALRRFLTETLGRRLEALKFRVICGPTGSGKTEFLAKSGRPFLDLESLAAHRGSAFGALERPQPTQIDFENRLAAELLRLPDGADEILIEDESRMIGARCLPEALWRKMKDSPRTRLETPLETRVDNILKDYILESRLGRDGDTARFDDFRRAVAAISSKLGGLRAREILADLDHAENEFRAGRGFDANREWIRKLLVWYYDPFYQRGLQPRRSDMRPAGD